MENENLRNFPYGIKRAENFAARGGIHDINSVGCPEPPPGLLGPEPLGAAKSSPYMPQPQTAGEKRR